jgi:bacterioferritin-associated ferredoxin
LLAREAPVPEGERAMIVCHCHALSDRDIRHVIRRGARTFARIVEECGAGGRCGGCRPSVEGLLDQAHGHASPDPAGAETGGLFLVRSAG